MSYLKIDPPFKTAKRVLALGAQSKSSFCFSKNRSLYVSVDGRDLSRLDDLERFESLLNRLKRKLNPEVIACDLHPEYASAKLAKEWAKNEEELKTIQHHEAHLASCMADNNLKGDVIGIVFDGTGLGLDGNIWGGEFFTGNIIEGFKRAAHLKYISMPGGELSIKEPWRMALSYLYDTGSRLPKRWDKAKMRLIMQAIDKGINSPLTSSMGRLFDAVSSIVGICDRVEYEAQAAMELEKAIDRCVTGDRYDFSYKDKDGVIEIDWGPLVKGIVKDLKLVKSRERISLKFHNAVCHMIEDVCSLLRKKYRINKVCMSGGVFQNRYLISAAPALLRKKGFDAYLHRNVPAHDGNIALGQAVIAAAG